MEYHRMGKEMDVYWSERSNSYSEQNRAQIENPKRAEWEKLILSNAPQKECLRILDIGTGPGFFAIILALRGHQVTAVDLTEEMLQKARQNAAFYHAPVEFHLLESQYLPFTEDTFDLVISRDVTWMLQEPEAILQEWRRVTRPGGRVLYFDANWYYYLFDEEARQRHQENQRLVEEKGGFTYAKAKIMENMAKILPLSHKLRPDWDREILPLLGFQKISVLPNVNDLVYTEKEQMQYESKPEFLVIAEK